MPYMRALAHLRSWVKEQEDKVSSTPMLTRVATHSCKATLLAWAKQLEVSTALRAAQGHHKHVELEPTMVNKYGRDDTANSLRVQRLIGQAGRSGTVFHLPQERGALPHLPGAPRKVAGPHPFFGTDGEAGQLSKQQKAGLNTADPEQPDEESESSSSSEASTDSTLSSNEAQASSSSKKGNEGAVWLVNETNQIVHLAVRSTEGSGVLTGGAWWRPACNTAVSNPKFCFTLQESLPKGATGCSRHGCRQIFHM